MQIQVIVPNNMIGFDNTVQRKMLGQGNDSQEYVFFDRGIESIIRRLQIFDPGGSEISKSVGKHRSLQLFVCYY